MGLSQEVVQEFQTSTVNFDLPTGITDVGAINVVTRSGSNDLHGTAFYFFRDHNLAAYPALNRDPVSGGFSNEDLVALLQRSRCNNERLGITGLLLYKDGNIIQVLERPDETVRDLFRTISADPLHEARLGEYFVYDAIDGHLLRELFDKIHADWAPDDRMKNYIEVPAGFGLPILR
jgi:hypothetical protein